MIRVTLDGGKETEAKLKAFSAGLADAVDEGMREGGASIVYDLQTYPDPPANSSYTRTYNYEHSITPVDATIVSPGVFEAKAGMPYDIFLRGTASGSYSGSWQHVGRWETLVAIVQSRLQGVKDSIISSISNLRDRLGL